MKTSPGDRKTSAHRPAAAGKGSVAPPRNTPRAGGGVRQPLPSVTVTSPVARTVGAPAVRVADELKTLAPQTALRGDFARALELYRTLAALEPTVPLHRIRAGDCLVKLGKKREALAEYRAAALAYGALSLAVHARSAWRLVLGIAPGDREALAQLAALDARARGAAGTGPSAAAPATAAPAAARPARVIVPPAPPAPVAPVAPTAPAAVTAPRALMADALALPDKVATPVVPARADVRARAPHPSTARRALGLEPLAKGEELMKEDEFCPITGQTGRGAAAPAPATPMRAASVPAAPTAPCAERRSKDRLALALEFADLDDEDDEIWIDLDPVVEEQRRAEGLRRGAEETEPVAYFAEDAEPDSLRRESEVATGAKSSLIEEQTRPVPPPDP